MADWDAFQADTLDILRQYEGYFDFFERVGSIEETRPDCLCRVSREDKKEIWIVDAKNKETLESSDLERLRKYREKIKSSPVEVGMDYSELSDHRIRSIVVMRDRSEDTEVETVTISSFHQFLQKELIYTDTGKLVRDISKMMKKGQLKQSEARILYESVEPYRESVEAAFSSLEKLEEDLSHLQLQMGGRQDAEVPVDCIVEHGEREKTFLIDIPYSRRALERIDEKIESLNEKFDSEGSDVYYSVVSLFGEDERELIYSPERIRDVIKRKAGIVSTRDIFELLEPKIPVKTDIKSGKALMKAEKGVGYRAEVSITGDYRVKMRVSLPDEAEKRLRNYFLNSRNDFGTLESSEYRLDFKVEEGHRVSGLECVDDLDSLEKAFSESFSSTVNPVLSRRFNTSGEEPGIN